MSRGKSERENGIISVGSNGNGPVSEDSGIVETPDPSGGSLPIIEPAAVSADSGNTASAGGGTAETGSGKRKRGRPKGSRNSGSKATASENLDVNAVAFILVNAHSMIASATKIEELTLEQSQGEALAQAIANVQRHYNVMVDPKTVDWIMLAQVSAIIYGPKIAAIRKRRKAEKEEGGQAPQGFGATPANLIYRA